MTKLKWIPLPRSERAERLNNPYCGLYSIFRFYADSDVILKEGVRIEEVQVEQGQQLCLVEINLLNFNERELTKEALDIIRRIFRHFSSLEKQLIVRFVYDWEGKGVLSEPKDLEIIVNHMSQLSPLLKEYTRDIYILQGLFIGSWGEMHNSRYLSERHVTRLARQIYECTGDKTQIALRCPSFWRMVFRTYQPLDKETAFTNIQKARFSLFNDGIMASETDLGTYGEISFRDSKSCGDKLLRKEELEFQNQLCRYVSNGGEVVNECPWNDAAPAIEALREMRISYLHSDYDERVLEKWKSVKSGINRAPWKDRTAFEYIVAHLGYRFTIEEASLSLAEDKSGNMRASVKISNQGFAPCYHPFTVKFVVRTASFSEVHEYTVDTDTRLWMPQDTVELEVQIPCGDLEQRYYILCFGIHDPRTGKPIQMTNTFSAINYSGDYSLGNFAISI